MNKVKALREKYGLTRKQFCDLFRIPYRTLQSWELNNRACPDYVFYMIVDLLEVHNTSGRLQRSEE